MIKNIARVGMFCFVLFLSVALMVAVMGVWDIFDAQTTQDLLVKIAYTFIAVFTVGSVVAMIKK